MTLAVGWTGRLNAWGALVRPGAIQARRGEAEIPLRGAPRVRAQAQDRQGREPTTTVPALDVFRVGQRPVADTDGLGEPDSVVPPPVAVPEGDALPEGDGLPDVDSDGFGEAVGISLGPHEEK